MTTHRRALMLRASAVVALVVAGLVGVASPAFADIGVSIGPENLDLRPGESRDFGITVSSDQGDVQRNANVTVRVPDALSGDLTITAKTSGCNANGSSANCNIQVPANGGERLLEFTITAKANVSVNPGSSKEGNGTVNVAGIGGGGQVNDTFNIKLSGPAQAASVTEVSGTVTDSTTGAPVKDATIQMADGANKIFNAATNNAGVFKFVPSGDKPIAPGTITLAAGKTGFEAVPFTATGRAGQALIGQKVKLKPAAAGASISAAPTLTDAPVSADPTAAGDDTAAGDEPTAKASSETSIFSWVLIVLGGLLVLLGIGAIVLLLRRGKDDDDTDDPDDVGPADPRGPARAGTGPRAAYRGGADPTMVGSPMGAAGRGNSMDATAIVRPPADDPYGMPTQPRSGYPSGAAGYVSPQSPAGYGAAGAYGATQVGNANGYASPSGYGDDSPGGGYGPSSRPAADGYSATDYADGYGPSAGGYSQSAGDYGQGNGYVPDDAPARYDAGGYSPAGGNGGGYADRGGYGDQQPAGYGSRGYEPADGGGYDRDQYEQRAPGARTGSADYDNGYGSGGGYSSSSGSYDDGQYGAPAQPPARQAPPARGADRRSLDWLDD